MRLHILRRRLTHIFVVGPCGDAPATGLSGFVVGAMGIRTVETHLASRTIEVLPEAERDFTPVTDMDDDVERQPQLIVFQILGHFRQIDIWPAHQLGTSSSEMLPSPPPALPEFCAIISHEASFTHGCGGSDQSAH